MHSPPPAVQKEPIATNFLQNLPASAFSLTEDFSGNLRLAQWFSKCVLQTFVSAPGHVSELGASGPLSQELWRWPQHLCFNRPSRGSYCSINHLIFFCWIFLLQIPVASQWRLRPTGCFHKGWKHNHPQACFLKMAGASHYLILCKQYLKQRSKWIMLHVSHTCPHHAPSYNLSL